MKFPCINTIESVEFQEQLNDPTLKRLLIIEGALESEIKGESQVRR